MRIVAGRYRGRVLHTFRGGRIRPTSDRLRETLFNILQGKLEGAVVWDAFAGTGAVGLEALSRGAARVVFTEAASEARALLRKNIDLLEALPHCSIFATDAVSFASDSGEQFDLVFLDPPYDFGRYLDLVRAIGASGICRNSGQIILEHHRKSAPVAQILAILPAQRQVRQGDSMLSFFSGDSFSRGVRALTGEGPWRQKEAPGTLQRSPGRTRPHNRDPH